MSRTVRDAFRDILGDPSLSGSALTTALESAGTLHGVEPFSACLQVLSAAPRDEAEARRTIAAIESHREALATSLGRDPGLAVAAADYLQVMEGQAWRTSLRLSRSAQASDPRESALDEMLATEQRRCERLARPMSLVLLAPDGGGLDDQAARAAGAALRDAARGVDRAVRLLPLGFAVVLPCTPGTEAARAAARLRVVAERATGVSWSAGVASWPGPTPGPDAMAAAARAALRLARRRGGGTVCQGDGDRRRTRRLKVGSHLSGSVQANGRALRAGLHDLSLSGALVRVEEEVPNGTRVVLTVSESAPRARVAAIAGRVVRTVRHAADPTGPSWRAAVAFDPGADAQHRVADLMATLPLLSAEPAGA